MTNDVKIDIKVNDSGSTAAITKEGEKLKKVMKDVAEVASNIRVPMATAAARQGVDASSAPRKASAQPGGVASDTNLSRGIGGQTGASGRDFAAQAQGLGGLVHVYATFAANLFAVSAAFTALKNAADTSNMIKGLDQLGAASGRGLGTLSKQLVEITGGALSFRDAMTSVSQASSAGLGNKQIQDLAAVASKASQALGIGMTDAVSRLSRGISKIEPELLDELGIFVKVDQATQKYALSIGKSAASLSDFEKRQAFANAVLEQGKEKFAAIEATANPFDKLLASASNLATGLLQIINVGLGPIVKLFSESSLLLGAGFALITATLIRQAIPALGNWQAGLLKSADAAALAAKKSHDSFMEYKVSESLEKESKKVPIIQDRINSKIADAQTTLAKTLANRSSIVKKSLDDTTSAGDMEKMLDREISLRKTKFDLDKLNVNVADTSLAKDRQKILNLQATKDLYIDIGREQKRIADIQLKSETPGFEEKLRKKVSDNLQTSATSKGILAQVGTSVETKGVGAAFTGLFDNIKKGLAVFDEAGNVISRSTQGLTGLKAVTTAAKGSFLILGSAIGTALSALGPYMQLFALVIAAYGVFDSYASKATKQQEEFNSKITDSESAVKTVNDTFDLYINKKKNAFNIEGISAFTTALTGISDALDAQVLAFKKIKEAEGTFDKLKDSIAGMLFFTDSNIEKLQKSTVEGVKSVVKSLELSGKSTEAKGIIAKALFGSTGTVSQLTGDTKDLNKAFDGLTETQREEKIARIAAAIDLVRKSEEYSTNAAKAFIESLSSIDKIVDQMVQANAFTDLQGKLGVELVVAAERLSQALSDPLKALEAINKLGSDPKALAALSNIDLEQLQKAGEYTRALNIAEKEKADAVSKSEKAKVGSGEGATKIMSDFKEAAKQRIFHGEAISGLLTTYLKLGTLYTEHGNAVETDIKNAADLVDSNTKKFESLKQQAAGFAMSQIDLVTKIADAGFAKIEIGLKKAKEQAQLTIEKSSSSIAASAGANTAQVDYSIKIRELDIQGSLIEANYAVQMATITNSQRLDELNNTMQLATAAQLQLGKTAEEKAAGSSMMEAALNRKNVIDASNILKQGGNAIPFTPEIIAAARSRNQETTIPAKTREAALAGVKAGKVIAGKELSAGINAETVKNLEQASVLEKQILATKTAELALASGLAPYESNSIINAKASIKLEELKIESAQQVAVLIKDQANLSANATKDEVTRLTSIFNKKMQNLALDRIIKAGAIDLNAIKEQGAADQAKQTLDSNIKLQNLQSSNIEQESSISLSQKKLDILVQLNNIDELSASRAKTKNEQDLLSLKYKIEEARLAADVSAKQSLLDQAKKAEAKIFAMPETPATTAALGEATKGTSAAQSALDASTNASAASKLANADTQEAIRLQQELNEKLIAQKQHLADMASLTESLGNAFGDTGTKVGGMLSALDSLNKNQKDREESLKNTKLTEKERGELVSKNTRAEVTDQAKLLGAAKGMFKEKSDGYKAIAKIEKVAHLYSIGLLISENVTKASLYFADLSAKVTAKMQEEALVTGITTTGFMARLPTYISEIYASWGAMGPWMVGAAGLFIASKLGGGGGGGSQVNMTGLTSEDRQSVAGTGQAYVNNVKVDTGGGVFGDSTAKSESITKSIEILAANSIEGLDYDNKLLKSFNKLADSLTNTAQAIYAIPGLRAGGTGFGTQPGDSTISKGGLFGSGFLSSVFGGGTSASASISSAGIQLRGSLQNIIDDTTGSITAYKDVLTQFHEDGGWFGSDSDWSTLTRQFDEVQKSVRMALSDVFQNAKDIMTNVGAKANIGTNIINDAFEKINFAGLAGDIDSMGLTGQAALDQLNAVIGTKLDETAKLLFSAFDDYKVFGEGFLETVIRVVDGNNKVDQSLRSMGNSFNILNNFDISDTVIKAAGSLQTFMEQASFFKDNFLSEAEKLVPVQKSVTDQLAKLHISTTITREDYKKLLLAQDLNTTGGRDMYQSLMELAPGFDIVTKAVETAATAAIEAAKTAAEARVSSEIAIYTALGDTENALTLTRVKELEALSDILKPAQKYLYALQNEATLKGKLTAAYTKESTAIKSTITSLTASIKTIKDYKESLTAGALSVLTPTEKYVQAATAWLDTSALAKSVITSTSTPEEIAARDAAIGKLATTSDAFLTLSKQMFNSSDRYLQDFSSVTDTLDSASNSLTNQETDAQKQLTALDASVSALNLIQVSTDTTANLLGQYLAIQTATEAARAVAAAGGSIAAASSFAIPGLAGGGIGNGITMVGERGPEIVDFKNPGRVYSNRASNDLLNTKDLVAEIKALREEVSQLRADQKEQTGHLIATNYDANSRNANTVATANDEALKQQDWKTRSQVKVA